MNETNIKYKQNYLYYKKKYIDLKYLQHGGMIPSQLSDLRVQVVSVLSGIVNSISNLRTERNRQDQQLLEPLLNQQRQQLQQQALQPQQTQAQQQRQPQAQQQRQPQAQQQRQPQHLEEEEQHQLEEEQQQQLEEEQQHQLDEQQQQQLEEEQQHQLEEEQQHQLDEQQQQQLEEEQQHQLDEQQQHQLDEQQQLYDKYSSTKLLDPKKIYNAVAKFEPFESPVHTAHLISHQQAKSPQIEEYYVQPQYAELISINRTPGLRQQTREKTDNMSEQTIVKGLVSNKFNYGLNETEQIDKDIHEVCGNISDISSLLLLANMKSPDIHQQVARIQQIEIPQQQQRGAEYNISELEPSEKIIERHQQRNTDSNVAEFGPYTGITLSQYQLEQQQRQQLEQQQLEQQQLKELRQRSKQQQLEQRRQQSKQQLKEIRRQQQQQFEEQQRRRRPISRSKKFRGLIYRSHRQKRINDSLNKALKVGLKLGLSDDEILDHFVVDLLKNSNNKEKKLMYEYFKKKLEKNKKSKKI